MTPTPKDRLNAQLDEFAIQQGYKTVEQIMANTPKPKNPRRQPRRWWMDEKDLNDG